MLLLDPSKKKFPFSFHAINEMKERKRLMNHKRTFSHGGKLAS